MSTNVLHWYRPFYWSDHTIGPVDDGLVGFYCRTLLLCSSWVYSLPKTKSKMYHFTNSDVIICSHQIDFQAWCLVSCGFCYISALSTLIEHLSNKIWIIRQDDSFCDLYCSILVVILYKLLIKTPFQSNYDVK